MNELNLESPFAENKQYLIYNIPNLKSSSTHKKHAYITPNSLIIKVYTLGK